MYFNGRAKDYVEAAKWFQKAAEQGNPKAQQRLADCYHYGEGVPQDPVEGLNWGQKAVMVYLAAAEEGSIQALDDLGWSYLNGRGIPADAVEAAKWFLKAAEQGYAKSQYALWICYHNGYVVPQEDGAALKWVRKAAEQGHIDAQFNLAYELFHNRPSNLKEAVNWFRKAAEQRSIRSYYYLGHCYKKGKGVVADRIESYKWFCLLADAYYISAPKTATKEFASVKALLSPADLQEAERRVAEFKASHPS